MRGIVSGAIIALFCVTARFGTPQSGSQKVLDNGTQVLNAKVYGAVCDGGSHPLSGYYGTLAAAQAVYPFITSLTQTIDYAAAKAAANVAFGPDGSEHANNTGLNRPLLFPAGTCRFGNDTLLIRNADGIRIEGAGKTATILQGKGIVLGFDGLWYSELSNFEVSTTSSLATVALDIDGNVPGHPYRTRGVQGNLLRNVFVDGAHSSYALAFCRQGGNNAQCSENTLVNLHLINASSAAILINGFNALDNVWIGGDIQGYSKHGIYLSNSTLKEIGVSFEPVAGCTQLNNGGYDIYDVGGVAGSVVSIGSRTEGLSFMYITGNKAYVAGLTQNAALTTWRENHAFSLATATEQTGTDGKTHLYCVTTAGTSSDSPPTWPSSGTVTDGTVVWTTTTFAALSVLGGGFVDFASSHIDPAGRVVTGQAHWQFGEYNVPSGWFVGDYVDGSITEQYMQNQSMWQSFYTNSNSSSMPSYFKPSLNLPASSNGILAQYFTLAARLRVNQSILSTSAVPTITGCGTISDQKGGGLAGTFQTDATSCTPVLTGLPYSPNGFACTLWDQTSPTFPIGNLSSTATSARFGTLTTTASDTLAFQCGLSY